MNDLVFEWQKEKAVLMADKLLLPQFKILGWKLNSCTKVYDSGKRLKTKTTARLFEKYCALIQK